MKKAISLLAFAFLTACGTQPTNDVQAAMLGYEAALVVAVKYNQLPRCGGTAVICSDPKVVAQLRLADNAAITTLTAARNVVVTPGATSSAVTAATAAATQAVSAFTAILASYNIK